MLNFRATQVEAIWLAQFAERMSAHLREYFPVHCAMAGEQAMHAAIRLSVQRARAYGFRLEASAQSLLDHMLMLGSQFDADPLLPWARELLSSTDHELKKLDALHARSVQLVDRAEDGSRPWLTALELVRRRGLDLGLSTLPSAALPQVERCLQELYPAKAGVVSAELPALVQQAERLAQEEGWSTPLALNSFLAVQLLLGTGALTDPMLPWVTQSLQAADLSAEARGQLLWKNFARFADAVLANAASDVEIAAESSRQERGLELRSA